MCGLLSDTVWSIFTENIISSIPWLIMHSIGTQFFQRFNGDKVPTAGPRIFNHLLFGCHQGHHADFHYLALFSQNFGMFF